MRTAALTLLSFVAFGYAAEAQKFSLLPQVGFENSKTRMRFNDLSSFSPAGLVFSPQASLHLRYRSKAGHGAFAGVASSRNTVPVSFTDPERGMNSFTSSTGKMQVRLEAGYQFTSKPIYLDRKNISPSKIITQTTTQKKTCGTYSYRSHCSKNKSSSTENKSVTQTQKSKINPGSWMRLLPSLGMGFIPGTNETLLTKNQNGTTAYEYRAGNINTAVMAGMGFEFGKNNKSLFTVNVNYLRGLGNPAKEEISSMNGTKAVTTHLNSSVSGWNLRFGIPFTTGAKKTNIKQQVQQTQIQKPQCRKYQVYKCNKII